MVRIEDADFNAVRDKFMKKGGQGTDDEQVMKDFMKDKMGAQNGRS